MSKSQKPYNNSLKSRVDALFITPLTDNAISSELNNASQTLAIEQIVLPPYQPRQYFDPDTLAELAESIKKHGILEPLLVRSGAQDAYELVAGGRRYRAAQLAELTEVPVVIKELDDIEAAEITLIENLAREDLNPVEETEGILRLLEIRLQLKREDVLSLLYRMRNEVSGNVNRNVSLSPEAKTVEEIFAPLGMSWKSFIETRLPLLKLPESILEALQQGKLAYTKAKAIAKVKDETARNQLLEEAIAQNLSLSQIKERIRALQSKDEDIVITPKRRVETTAKRINDLKLWESDPKKWKRIESLLQKIEGLLASDKL